MTRVCPRCRLALAIRAVPVGGGVVDIDACGACGGSYLDAGELGVLLARPDVEHLLKCYLVGEMTSDFACPSCGNPMDEATFTGTTDVVIDVCATCRGIWLDGGEARQMSSLPRGFAMLPPEERARAFERDMAIPRAAAGGNLLALAMAGLAYQHVPPSRGFLPPRRGSGSPPRG